ncbi:unnamed protein product [Parnassius apollo]|uniref:(apollo) hypothetical protein n=1 Tax=Parnassius apollo TaxID=110799 RepID=A0A8S3WCU5_PARAO|nr:unnamed protein product [Parnassius apollo]
MLPGYEYIHSFLDESTGLTVSSKFVLPLYQHIVNVRHPNMAFLGVVKQVITRVMDAQDHYFANLINEGGVVRATPVLTEIRDFNAKNRLDDLLNYRDYDYETQDNNHYDRKYNPRPENTCPVL